MPEFLMNDGNNIFSRVVSGKAEIDRSINLLLEEMLAHDDMLVGFDTEYCFEEDYGRTTSSGQYIFKKRISLLTLCTQSCCVLIRIPQNPYNPVTDTPRNLYVFLANKDIVFVGVHKKKDLTMLQNEVGLQITNAVELSELPVRVLGHHPCLGACGARKLASYLHVLQIEPRSSSVAWSNWKDINQLTDDQIECATADAYAAYKIGKKLLEI